MVLNESLDKKLSGCCDYEYFYFFQSIFSRSVFLAHRYSENKQKIIRTYIIGNDRPLSELQPNLLTSSHMSDGTYERELEKTPRLFARSLL